MIKDSLILTFSKGVRSLLMLIFNIIIVRLFSESLYGTYKHITLIINLTTLVCSLGIPVTISYFYSNFNKEKRDYLIGNTLVILSFISIITSSIIILFKNQISKILNNPEILSYINIISIYVIIMIISSFLENLYISSENSVLLGKIYIVYIIFLFFGMTISAVVFKSLYLLVFVTVIIEMIRFLVMYFNIKFKLNFKFKIKIDLMINQIKFAIPLGVVTIVQNLNSYIDNLFISSKFSTEKYAAYANAATDIPFVSIITVAIATVVLPRMVKKYAETNDFKDVLKIWGESSKNTAIIMFPIFWIAFLFSKGYIEFIFSHKYIVDSTPIFIIYLLKFPLYCTVYGNLLLVLKRQNSIMYTSLFGVTLNIVLNKMFINMFGINGPAISTVLVQYIIVFSQLTLISKYSNIKIKNLLPFKELMNIFIIPSSVAIPIFIIWKLLNYPMWIGLIIGGCLIYAITMVIYYKAKYIRIEVIKNIMKFKP